MKFIQITSARLENNQQTQANWILHALDSDGRIWELDDMHGWREVPLPIPASAQETPAGYDPHDHTHAAYMRAQKETRPECPDGNHDWMPMSNPMEPVQERICTKCKKHERAELNWGA